MDSILRALLEQIGRSGRFREACGVTLSLALREVGLRRGVVVVRTERGVRGAGVGVAEERLRALLASSPSADPALAGAFAGGGPRLVGDPAPLPGLDFASYAVLPFRLASTRGPGLVIVEADGLDERTAFVGDVFDAAAPALDRCLELERLERRTSDLERRYGRLAGVVDSMGDPVVLTENASRDILFANRRAEHLLTAGGTDGAAPGRARTAAANYSNFREFLGDGALTDPVEAARELTLIDPDSGTERAFEAFSVPLDTPGESASGETLSVLRDVTDLKRAVAGVRAEYERARTAERRARNEWHRLSAILASAGDPILVTDAGSNIVRMNREAERLFDLTDGRDIGSPAGRAVQANDERLTALLDDFAGASARRRVEHLRLTDPDTMTEFPAEVVISKIDGDDGESAATVSILHDLTHVVENERLAKQLQELNDELEDRIRRATEELEERNRELEWHSQELEKASQLKSDFLANMSHELRTPINALLGYAAILREGIYGDLTDQQETALAKISVAAQHLLALINDILDLSKIEAGQMLLHLEEIRIERLVDEISETIEPLVREKSLAFDIDLRPPLPSLETDATKVRQILLNLLSNAVKFTHEGGVELRVRSTDDGRRVRIQVEDTGIGIRREELATIFDDFRQGDQSATREYGGTGLGLSITKKLLSLLGGTIAVASELGEGSCFTVELPVRTDAGTRGEQLRRAVLDADRAVVNAEARSR